MTVELMILNGLQEIAYSLLEIWERTPEWTDEQCGEVMDKFYARRDMFEIITECKIDWCSIERADGKYGVKVWAVNKNGERVQEYIER